MSGFIILDLEKWCLYLMYRMFENTFNQIFEIIHSQTYSYFT